MTPPTTTPPSRARTATWILAATSIVLFLASVGLGIAYYASVADRDSQIERLRDDIAAQDGTIAEQADTIATQDDRVTELDGQLQQAQQERDDMRPCFEAATTLADASPNNQSALERAVDDLLARCGS